MQLPVIIVPLREHKDFFLALYLKNHCGSSNTTKTTVQMRNRKQPDETEAAVCQLSRQIRMDGNCNIP